jgi:hypothetical protein
MCDLAQLPVGEFVEPRVADVTDRGLAALDDCGRHDAGHPLPLFTRLGAVEDLVIGERDGFVDALGGAAGLTPQARADNVEGDVGGLIAGGVTADTVDNDEDALVRLAEEAVFVFIACAAGV